MQEKGVRGSKGGLKRALAVRFVGWMAALLAVESLTASLNTLLLAPLLAFAVRRDYALGTARGIFGIIAWAFSTVWTGAFSNGNGVRGLLSGSAAVLLVALMLVLVVAPVVVAALLFARQAEGLVRADLAERDEELRRAYERRNLMISDMAHDLRTPVMGIAGMAQALEEGLVTGEEERARMLHAIAVRSEKISDLVSLLFDVVKLESEGFELDRKEVDLPQLLLREAASAYADIEQAGMELSVHVSEEPVSLWADEAQLGRVVANLLSNAVRHNPAGTTVELALGRRAGVADIIVADNGPLIEQDVSELFEPFARGDVARAGGGSGLGLSIVKGIVDMHGYRIELQQPYGPYTKAFVVTCGLAE